MFYCSILLDPNWHEQRLLMAGVIFFIYRWWIIMSIINQSLSPLINTKTSSSIPSTHHSIATHAPVNDTGTVAMLTMLQVISISIIFTTISHHLLLARRYPHITLICSIKTITAKHQMFLTRHHYRHYHRSKLLLTIFIICFIITNCWNFIKLIDYSASDCALISVTLI